MTSVIYSNINIVAHFVTFLIISNSKLVSIHIWLRARSDQSHIRGLHLLLYRKEILFYTLQKTYIPTNTKCSAFLDTQYWLKSNLIKVLHIRMKNSTYMTQLLLCPSSGPKWFWICLNCFGLDSKTTFHYWMLQFDPCPHFLDWFKNILEL